MSSIGDDWSIEESMIDDVVKTSREEPKQSEVDLEGGEMTGILRDQG